MSTNLYDPNYISNGLLSSSAASGVSGGLTINTTTSIPPYMWGISSSGTSSGTFGNSISYTKINIKRCRECRHAHLEGQVGCIEVVEVGQMVIFVSGCACKEYIPSDNLEFLEWKFNKSQKEEVK